MNFFLILAFLSLLNTAHAQNIVYATSTAPEVLEATAVKYGIYAPSFIATAKCESGFNNVPPHWDVTGNSYGVFQFHWGTFYKWAPLAGISDPDITDPMQQIQTAAYMFSQGQQHQWTCARQLGV